jgi:hypothetical protein
LGESFWITTSFLGLSLSRFFLNLDIALPFHLVFDQFAQISEIHPSINICLHFRESNEGTKPEGLFFLFAVYKTWPKVEV